VTDGVVILDKPAGVTSFRAVRNAGRILGQKKCGHAGTLDPMATGVLLVCAGRATKIAGYLAAQEKTYEAAFRFGVATDTGDVTGRPTETRPGAYVAEEAVAAAVATLVGAWDQVPPAHSAVKVEGVRSYVLARQGKSVALSPRRVSVYEARLLSWSPEGFSLTLRCSKGFYVRSLARDLRTVTGVPMTVSALRRLASGPFRIEEAVSLAVLEEARARGEAERFLIPIETALDAAGYPRCEIPAEAAAAVRHGRSPGPWLAGRVPPGGAETLLLTHGIGGPVALVARDVQGGWKIVRGI
jgi:tRNA pseudouridine55 synthase